MGHVAVKEAGVTSFFSAKQIDVWRNQVNEQRDLLFRRNWKNRRPVIGLRSREQESNFRFVVGWCEEFSDVVGRRKERQRLDKLIAIGVDVNLPREEQPEV